MKKIFIQGYATSGMTALRDFLFEFEGNYVVNDEFDLIRHSDGILSLEKSLLSNNDFWHDASIRRYKRLVDFLFRPNSPIVLGRDWKNKVGNDFQKVSYDYIDNLISCEKKTQIQFYNQHAEDDIRLFFLRYYNSLRNRKISKAFLKLFRVDDLMKRKVFFTKNFTLESFISLTAQYINEVLMLMSENKTITLMHPLMITGNIEHQLKYFGDAKILVSNRDPRDVFVDVVTKRVQYIPWDNLDDFINWFRNTHINHPIVRKDVLNINFEDLVSNYDQTSSKIIDFLGFDQYNRKVMQKFNPEKSKKNTGLYKNFSDQSSISRIEKELSEYCYKL